VTTVAHVTGAGTGIGRAVALRVAREGMAVVVSDVDEAGGRETATRIGTAGGRASFVRADVTSEDDVRAAIAFTEATFGGLDVLVNNAGGAPEPHFPEADLAHWRRTVELNLFGVMLPTHHALPALQRRGGGAIVNVSSMAGIGLAAYGAPEYAAAKAAVWRLTAALGGLAGEGIRVTCICPDWVETERILAEREALGEEAWAKVGPRRLVPAESIADAILVLARDRSLAGRVLVCPLEGEWGLLPIDGAVRVEALPEVRRFRFSSLPEEGS
jgi:NAD(P)-dependent dehydrogenase (short-subunit alcohol dehydrogenase family)